MVAAFGAFGFYRTARARWLSNTSEQVPWGSVPR
jgi:hypothetical protein